MNLVIDVGNSRVKAAVFEQHNIVELFIFEKNKIVSEVKKILKHQPISSSIISSVSNISLKQIDKLKEYTSILVVDATLKIPFKNLYATPNTLGVDRIALVSAAVKKFPKSNVLVIDAGTCITFDFINSSSEYLGGAISPGLEMRYKALQKFTSKLPLLNIDEPKSFIGNSTEQSIHSGVINGVVQEIDGVVGQYQKKYLDLTIVLTGGDTNFLSKQLKSSIFANQNFLLEGLNEILIFNQNK
ncbi:MAG: type III pantothenate kinase [Polaribacter sp.]|uniref:type III pantothenate kinase n=1 Tax=Polaribacter sp. TaxID=1920175 RepID=UPI003BB1BCB8